MENTGMPAPRRADDMLGRILLSDQQYHAVAGTFRRDVPNEVQGPLGPKERVYLYHAGGSLYEGRGALVELGAFLGASTQALCAGLARNPHAEARGRKLETYDLFFYDESWGQQGVTRLYGIKGGEDFLDKFKANLGSYIDRVTVRQGDLMMVEAYADDIEILFVDVAKTEALMAHIAEVFLPKLMVGGLYINQDFFITGLSFIKSFTEYFADYFEWFDPGFDSTVVFRLVKAWDVTREDINRYMGLPIAEKQALHARANARFGAARQEVLAASLENMTKDFVRVLMA